MKRIIILFFAIITTFSVDCQNCIQDGDKCFDRGDYNCAITNYNKAFRSASGKEKQIAEIRLMRARSCTEWEKSANQAFNNKNYGVAKENYQKVLDSNPNDASAKAWLEECNYFLNTPRHQLLPLPHISSLLSTRLLTEDDIRGLSKQDLRILRNEIYARHGYIFKSKDLREYFSAKPWYNPQYNDASDVSIFFNTIEKKNVEFIKKHE